MIEPLLQQELLAVFRRQRRVQRALQFALSWGALALLGLLVILLKPQGASLSPAWVFAFATLGVIAGATLFVRNRHAQPDWHQLARRIEMQHPELEGVLLTAVQQQPAGDGQLHYLQRRIVREALIHCLSHPWSGTIPRWHVAAAQVANLVALAAFVWALAAMHKSGLGKSVFAVGWTEDGVTLTPGDASRERGERLVVVASFAGRVPAKVELVTTPALAPPSRTALVKSLSDPV